MRDRLPLIALFSVATWSAWACTGGPPVTAAQPAPDGSTTGAQTRSTSGFTNRPHIPTGPLPAPAPISAVDADGELVDPIASLQSLLEAGEVTFSFDSVTGYLPSVLAALDIPLSSQTLIFSRTSLQTMNISPWAPRGVYFNDDVYVGYVSDESPMLEIGAVDPDDGGTFYILPQDPDSPPGFLKQTRDCLGCHEAGPTMRVPGFLVRSTVVDRHGWTIRTLHDEQVTDRTPWDERFAGWYVTGTHEGPSHGGNVRAELESHEVDNPDQFAASFDLAGGGNVTDISDRLDLSVYLSGHSDLVALLVLTHQSRIHNVITTVHATVEEALRDQTAARVTRGIEIPESGLTATTEVRIDSAVEQLVREMFFSREAPIPGPVRGTTTFAQDFEARGPFDHLGRTLRSFDLETRLFRYPLSFLVYTEAFDAIPDVAKSRVYDRIDEVLTGQDQSDDFAHLDADVRAAIRDILMETKADFAAAVQ
jgi:hypothetical protein